MRETQIDLQLLATFSTVAEESSFSKAAARLGVAKGTVSRSIAQLEEHLGVELVHRTTHHVSLSTAGTALHERTRGHLTALRSAVVDLPEREEAPSGLLRITAPPDFGVVVLPSVLAAFSRRFPNVRFDVRLSGQHVDLVKEGYDLAIRVAAGPLKDSSLTSRKIGKGSAGFYAAPSYVARRGRPKQLGDERHTWILHRAVTRLFKVELESAQFFVDDFLLARDLMSAAVGVGILPEFLARGPVREGLLEEIPMSGASQMGGDLVMLYPSSGQIPKKVSAFRDFVVESLRAGM